MCCSAGLFSRPVASQPNGLGEVANQAVGAGSAASSYSGSGERISDSMVSGASFSVVSSGGLPFSCGDGSFESDILAAFGEHVVTGKWNV